ncbi:MAG: response regulator transcription factor [Intrasporangium sp.]|uniref:helix-turn-helix transcriptional regulator n=1 Tax=Intrasporangium sp. TaxID=1925024 RepID=UPI002647B3EB|nr:response regulator transcription factor [Intrasporangium sp.]MDN5797530.1 response regulator transcription factor [Intrasporangium sp.]
MERVGVHVQAMDPISAAGVIAELRPRPEVRLLGEDEVALAQVAVVVVDVVDDATIQLLRRIQRGGRLRTVLIASRIGNNELVSAIEVGVLGLLRREEATPGRMVNIIQRAATGDGTVPPDLLGRLLDQVGQLQRQVLSPRGLTFQGLANREVEVLRLVADGYSTGEIASRLCYSERTVKNVLHDITTRLQVRNRPHAVAYAMREGLI